MIDLVVVGLDRVLALIAERLDDVELPLIGDRLEQATTFLPEIRERVIGKLEEIVTMTDDAVADKINEALGPGGLGWLMDRSGDGARNQKDISVTFDTETRQADVSFSLGGTYTVANPIQVDFGLDGLGLEIDSDLNLDVSFQFDVGFSVSADQGFALWTGQVGDDPELDISLDATISDAASGEMANATASLGFLQFTANDKLITRPDGSQSGSYFAGTFQVDLKDPNGDGKLTMAEIEYASGADEIVQTRLAADANVQLGLKSTIGDGTFFPGVESDFALRWQSDTDDPSLDGSIEHVGFSDVRINFGDFVDNLVEPVLDRIRKVTEPVRPVAEVLTKPIPVLSDLAGSDITLLGLAKDAGFIGPETEEFVQAVLNFGVNLPDYGGWIDVGTMNLDGDAVLDGRNFGQLEPDSSVIDGPNQEQNEQIGQLKERTGFAFPIWDRPADAFGLLLGRDVTLVTYDMPDLDFNLSYEEFFPIVGPLGANFKGKIGATADFKFGFDTSGLRQFRAGDYQDPALILNGFFVSDTANPDGTGDDVNEVEFNGKISAHAAIDALVASAGVGGGINATVALNLHDFDDDGKLHWQEIVGQIDQGSLFDVNGALTAYLNAYVKVGLGPLSKTSERNFGEIELASFNWEPEVDTAPILGEITDGELTLNIGPRAGERLYGETHDDDERFEVAAGEQDNEVVVTFYGKRGTSSQATFSNVTRIVADGGAGNDQITVGPGVSAELQLRGGAGNDTLQASDGPAMLLGGDGKDELIAGRWGATLDGGDGDDALQGGDGNDSLRGGAGNDTIHGGAGADRLEGGDGADELYGDAGADTLVGGHGDDVIYGGADADSIDGNRGQDELHGDAGIDTVSGGHGNDNIYGDGGADELRGDDGDDVIRGGDGTDTIHGGSGNDSLDGGAGRDLIFASLGSDALDGGADDDVLHGGVGSDELLGGGGDDMLYGENGVDMLFGQFGNDTLFGGIHEDLLDGGRDDDLLLGGKGNDSLRGGRGNDVLQGEEGSDKRRRPGW